MWIIIQRLSLVLLTAISMDQILGVFSSNHIKPDKIYSISEVAKMLKVKTDIVRILIKRGDLKARKLHGKYKILGQSIKDFLQL